MQEEFPAERAEFARTLREHGLLAALKYLNGRTAYRFTGVYRYDGDTLRNIALYDRWSPELRQGVDAPMSATYCAILGGSGGDALVIENGREDPRFPRMAGNAVVSYCGVLMRDEAGAPIGTLCHFDMKPSEGRPSELPLLRAAADLVYEAIQPAGALHVPA